MAKTQAPIGPSSSRIAEILDQNRRIAAFGLGASPRSRDYDFDIAEFLCLEGYELFPVGPFFRKTLPVQAYPRLSAIPGGVDLAAIFPGLFDVERAVDESLRAGVRTLWFQRGVSCPTLARRAARSGAEVVYGRCLRGEYLARWTPAASFYPAIGSFYPEMSEVWR